MQVSEFHFSASCCFTLFHNQNSCCRPDQSSTIKTVALRTSVRRAPFHSVACSHQFWNLLMSLFSFQGAASDLSRSDLSAPCLHQALRSALKDLVGQSGLEPPTSRLSVVCSSQLSYWPLGPLREPSKAGRVGKGDAAQ